MYNTQLIMSERAPITREVINERPQKRRYSTIDHDGYSKAIPVGVSHLKTVVEAAITVFSIHGGQDNKTGNAIQLATSLNTAYSLGVPTEELEEAVTIGQTIGVYIRNNENAGWTSAHISDTEEKMRLRPKIKLKAKPSSP